MKGILIFFLLLSALPSLASSEISVSDADMIYNKTLMQFNILTQPQAVSSIFMYNDNGNSNNTLEAVRIPTAPRALSRIFTLKETSKESRQLEKTSIPTEKRPLRKIFVVHEFAESQRDLVYPKALLNDTVSPAISGIAVDKIESSRARINWTTDEYTSSVVMYMNSVSDNETISTDTLFAINHSITLDELLPGSRYYFVISSTDRSGNSAESTAHEFETSWT